MLFFQEKSNKCDGCGRCQVACSFGLMVGLRAQEQGLPRLRRPLLWLDEIEGKRRISICRHCEIPLCVDACVSGALWVDQASGTVRVHQRRCIACYSCVMECPFGAIRIFPPLEETSTDGVLLKCDGCLNCPAPLCVLFCPRGALKSANGVPVMAANRRRQRATLIAQSSGLTGPIGDMAKDHG